MKLTSEEITKKLFSDLYSYQEFIETMVTDHLENSKNSEKIYWDAWFRGAEGKELEDADRGISLKL
jgi:hypothetical protein